MGLGKMTLLLMKWLILLCYVKQGMQKCVFCSRQPAKGAAPKSEYQKLMPMKRCRPIHKAIAQWLKRPLQERYIIGLRLCCVISKALKMVLVALLLMLASKRSARQIQEGR